MASTVICSCCEFFVSNFRSLTLLCLNNSLEWVYIFKSVSAPQTISSHKWNVRDTSLILLECQKCLHAMFYWESEASPSIEISHGIYIYVCL